MGKTINTKENKRNTGNKRKTDFPKFRERLIELEKKRNGELNITQAAKFLGVSRKTYHQWVNGEYNGEEGKQEYKVPSIDNLISIANKYNVSTDYLLGISDFTTAENSFICQYTGLSEDTVKALTYYEEYKKDLLHNMVSDSTGDLLSGLISSMYLYCAGVINDVKAFDIDQEEISLAVEEKEGMIKFQATDSFSLILHRLHGVYHDYRMDTLDQKIELLKLQNKEASLQ